MFNEDTQHTGTFLVRDTSYTQSEDDNKKEKGTPKIIENKQKHTSL